LAFSPDGRILASVSKTHRAGADDAPDDDAIHLWDVATGREVLRLEPKDARARSLSFSADGNSLVSGMDDTTTLIWNVRAR
jgi:WD40 repeat protein